ncbi:MAG: PocR ligand-binding domain-containing protein [Oscillospiraceae bacterium]|nr:PocR ligand-binding domain-containing protein [Oscillospiraceae bacterium]
MAEIKLTDLISAQKLQEIQDGFANLTGMAALTTDANGAPVTNGSNFTEFCMELTRQNREGSRRCEECDRSGGEKTMMTRRSVSYSCHAGLVDFAAPIMLNGEMIGSFIGGQVLTEEPDEDKFRAIARELGIDEDKYISALKKVKIVDRKQVEAAADFLFTIANLLSSTAYDAYISRQSSEGLTSLSKSMYSKVDDATGNLNLVTKRLSNLSSSFDRLEELAGEASSEVGKTTSTLKQIQDTALNTKILGFNASIEASRAKESGKGFGVIAQEVRSLAETSKSSADSIQSAMGHIDGYTKDINEQISQTRAMLTQCIADINKFSSLLDEIRNMK